MQPDLILLDIGLPKLNGMEVARRLGNLAPEARILFFSLESSSDVVREAFRLGEIGYVHNPRIPSELLLACEAVLGGERFVSSNLKGWESTENGAAQAPRRHDVEFCSKDEVFLKSFSGFIADALKMGNAVIVCITKAHEDNLLQRLKTQGAYVDAAIQQGTYISLHATDTLSTIMVIGLPDRDRFFAGIRGLIDSAVKAAKTARPRLAFCGERVGLLWAEGKTDAAIRLEQLCNELAKTHDVDIPCAYPLSSPHGKDDEDSFKRICAERSAVYSG